MSGAPHPSPKPATEVISEHQMLAEERKWVAAIANVAVSLVLGVAAAALGRLIGAQL